MSVPSATDMRRVATGDRPAPHNPAFDHVLVKAANVVRAAARQKFTSVAYKVPDYVQGYPVYKVQACMAYVAGVFEAKGYRAHTVPGNLVVLSWAGVSSEPPGVTAGVPAVPMDPEDKFSSLRL